MKFSHELVLPKVSYERLVALLLQSVQDELHMATGVVAMLDALLADRLHTELTDRDLVALTLVRNFQPKRKTVSAIRFLVGGELAPDGTHTATTLFRGNSLASKTVDQFMKVYGLSYLHATIKPLIDQILRECIDCEVDITKVPPRPICVCLSVLSHPRGCSCRRKRLRRSTWRKTQAR
jgi:hypothetical protein